MKEVNREALEGVYELFCRRPGEDWNQSGCWNDGGDSTTCTTEDEAKAACAHLAELYPDVDWGYLDDDGWLEHVHHLTEKDHENS